MSSTRRHPLPRVQKSWIPLHNAQVRVTQNIFRWSNQHIHSPKSEKPSARISLQRWKDFTQTSLHLFWFMSRKETQTERRAGCLKPNSCSKWKSLNRAPMNITTFLDLKSPGIFCRDCMRFARRNSPLSTSIVASTHCTARSMCPHALYLPSYIMLLCAFYCNSFEQENGSECSCINH